MLANLKELVASWATISPSDARMVNATIPFGVLESAVRTHRHVSPSVIDRLAAQLLDAPGEHADMAVKLREAIREHNAEGLLVSSGEEV